MHCHRETAVSQPLTHKGQGTGAQLNTDTGRAGMEFNMKHGQSGAFSSLIPGLATLNLTVKRKREGLKEAKSTIKATDLLSRAASKSTGISSCQ